MHRTCTHHERMNSAFNLWKTQKWSELQGHCWAALPEAQAEPGLPGRGHAETGALREGERQLEVHFCFVLPVQIPRDPKVLRSFGLFLFFGP